MIRIIMSSWWKSVTAFVTRTHMHRAPSDQKTGALMSENSDPAPNSIPAMPPPQEIPLTAPAKAPATKGLSEKPEKSMKAHARSSRINSPSPFERKLMEEMERRVDKLQRENTYLRKLLAAAKAETRAGVNEIANSLTGAVYDQLLAAYGLPIKTMISAGGWKKEIPLMYSQERDAFCDCLREKYTEEEWGRIANAIRFLAKEGPQRSRNSLKTKILRRELLGTPRDAHYSRASHNLRFTWKQIGDALWIFGAYKHSSGHANALQSIK